MTSLCVRASRMEFDMVFQTKCIYQDVDFDETSIAGYYKAFHKDDPTVLVRLGFTVEGPGGEKLYNADAQEQSFYFEDTKEGEYKLCWNAKGGILYRIISCASNTSKHLWVMVVKIVHPFVR